jgi:hypothetical protein
MDKVILAAVVVSIGGCVVGSTLFNDMGLASILALMGFLLTVVFGSVWAFLSGRRTIGAKLSHADFVLATDEEGVAIDVAARKLFVGSPDTGKIYSFDEVRGLEIEGEYLYVITGGLYTPRVGTRLGSPVVRRAYDQLLAVLGDQLNEVGSDDNTALSVAASEATGYRLDLYELLGVLPDAPSGEIREAYLQRIYEFRKSLLQPTHPDHQRLTELEEAYKILSEPEKKAEYDRLRARRLLQIEKSFADTMVREKGAEVDILGGSISNALACLLLGAMFVVVSLFFLAGPTAHVTPRWPASIFYMVLVAGGQYFLLGLVSASLSFLTKLSGKPRVLPIPRLVLLVGSLCVMPLATLDLYDIPISARIVAIYAAGLFVALLGVWAWCLLREKARSASAPVGARPPT